MPLRQGILALSLVIIAVNIGEESYQYRTIDTTLDLRQKAKKRWDYRLLIGIS